jgi:hypothetical protein
MFETALQGPLVLFESRTSNRWWYATTTYVRGALIIAPSTDGVLLNRGVGGALGGPGKFDSFLRTRSRSVSGG